MRSKILYIGNKLSNKGNTVTTIETLGLLLEKEGYTLYYASSKENQVVRMLDMIYKTIQYRTKVDYVLIDTYNTLNFWYAFIISQMCRWFKLKYVPILHGGDLPNRLRKSPKLSELIFKNAYKNSAPSGYLLEAFKNKGYAEIVFIPNTIELENYPFELRYDSSPQILWVRSLCDIYNPEMALKVFYEIKKEFPEATLCMVGPDKVNILPKLKELAKQLNLEVTFTGKMKKAEWVALSKNYSVFINTTHFDNTPVSVMEAMALGLPVVSTNVGGIPYLLEDHKTALLVDDNDVQAMVDGIKKLTNDPKFKDQMVQNALEMVSAFDWNAVKHKWNEILD